MRAGPARFPSRRACLRISDFRVGVPVCGFRIAMAIWRVVCWHLEIRESASNLHPLLAEELPLAAIVLRRFDGTERTLETVAVGKREHAQEEANPVTTIGPAWNRIQHWAKSGQIEDSPEVPRSGIAAQVIPDNFVGHVLAGPLQIGDRPNGVVLLQAKRNERFQAGHRKVLSLLLEPFSLALENDRRLHELATLREAAEADRRSLLTRLGRQDINEAVVGAETGLRHVMERVQLVAQSDVPVLILGETGTGKEVVARAIHSRSRRADGPFIRVNCGAIPPELIDSQLFGHEKGSFTGAAAQHQGWFERADGGTLFLDEIGELPLPAQVRLLRVLQDHQVERVGGKSSIHVDVRIVTATHRDLASMVKAKSFREDLWYRINVFPILLPRLRERMEDIPALVRHFVQRAAHRFGLPAVEPSPADLRLLMNYPWPGNIRELGAVIDRAAILGKGKTLEVTTSLGLSQPIPTPSPASSEPVFYEVIPEDLPSTTLPRVRAPAPVATLNEAMKQHIEQSLIAARGQVEGKNGAAAMLGINPHTLRARMRKLGIDWARFR
ncbi:MAG: Formate hydrogenlyase transcriptional activator [Planctomycetota bacterium]